MSHNLTHEVKTYKLSGAVAAGVDGAVVNLTEIDMMNFKSARIIFVLGAIAANGVFTSFVKNSDTSGTYGAGTIDKVGASLGNDADTDDDKIIIHDISEVQRRYLRPSYQRTVGNVTIECVIVELYSPDNKPVTQATTQVEAYQVLNNPTPSAT